MVQPADLKEPLKFKPILQSKIWGGNGLFRVLNKGLSSDHDVGESWELSDREESSNLVSQGTFAGQSMRELFNRHAREILGNQYSPNLKSFPLLYKFIYAREHLSVQVHPGENSPLGEAKTECWYILEAPENAELILGMAGKENREKTFALLASKDCESVLNHVQVESGDLLFIPAGTVHAITAGLLLYEVQQNSDTTFRLYDWGRVDSQGKSRQLHIQESYQVLDLRQQHQHKIKPLLIRYKTHKEEFRVACAFFTVIKLFECVAPVSLHNDGRFRVLTCIRGSFELVWDGGKPIPIELGDTVLIPALCQNPTLMERENHSEILMSFIPKIEEEVFKPLLAEGYSDAEIKSLGGLEGLA